MAVGVTVIVAVTGFAVLFVPVNAGVLPVPLDARPIDASELVQSNVVPGVVLVKFEATIVAPLQTIISEGTTTKGVGLTVIVYEDGVPGQPLAAGVTVIVAVTGSAVLFVPVNAGVSPVPLAARPIVGSEFVHANVAPGVVLVKFEAAIAAPLQTAASAGTVTFGPGFTVMEYEFGIPGQPFAVGVTIIVEVTESAVLFVPENEAISPVPLAARPMEGSEFVQVNVVPGVVLVKLVAKIISALQITISEGTTTTGVGLTVIVYEDGVPGQPLAVGVTVTVAVTGFAVVFVPVKEGVLPVPLAPRPILASELIQSNVAPGVVLVNTPAATFAVLHTVTFAGTVTFGPGFTVIVYAFGVPGQPLALGVTVILAVTGSAELFVAENEGVFPVPLAARPIEGVEFVQVKVVPDVVLVNAEAATVVALQTIIFVGTITTGIGLIVIE